MTHWLRVAGIMGILLIAIVPAMARQDSTKTQTETPVLVLQKFKAAVDRNDYATICKLMAEDDASGPLKPVRYEQMQRSLEGLVNMWRGTPFHYSTVTVQTKEGLHQSTVHVNVLNLRQEVRFVLLKFGTSWYIFDIEIFFK